MRQLPATLLALVLLASCASNRFEASVTRFHLGAAPAPTTVAVRALNPAEEASLSFRTLADAVSRELASAGFRTAPAEGADVLVFVGMGSQFSERTRSSPVSIGIGGATGGNVSVGGAMRVPVGGGGVTQVVTSELQLVMRRRSDNEVLWEGRASATGAGRNGQPTPALLARALLDGYPGQSGQTVRWVAK